MRHFSMWMLAAAMFCGLGLIGQTRAADGDNPPPPKQGGGPGGPDGGGPGGPGGRGGPPGGFHLIPRFAVEKMNLTDDQKKQIADLEKEVKTKLAAILTPAQMKTLKEARPPRPGQGGPGPDQGGRQGGGGQQGGPGGRPPGGPDGNPNGQRPPGPPQN